MRLTCLCAAAAVFPQAVCCTPCTLSEAAQTQGLQPGESEQQCAQPCDCCLQLEDLKDLSLADDVSSPAETVGPDVFDGRVDGLYIILISLHGLVRGDKMELGKDADTGGQVGLSHRLSGSS